MRTKFILTIAAGIILYFAGIYYIGLRLWQSIGSMLGYGFVSYYWVVFVVLAGTYFWGRIAAIYLPGDMSDKLIWFGSYGLGIAFYMLLLWIVFDTFKMVGSFMGFWPNGSRPSLYLALFIAFLASAIVYYGNGRASTPEVRHYDITINKPAGKWNQLRVVLISDIHAGLLVGRARLERAVRIINDLDPDLVLMPGDIIDENIGAFVENEMPEVLLGIRSRLGVFGVLGSHEYIWGHSEKSLASLRQAGIHILRDNYVKLDECLYIVGRDDLFREQIVGTPRKDLSVILGEWDSQLPIILMDHQPVNLDEARLVGIDLQLSGHTHHGQIYPINLITKAIFKKDWGYLKNDKYQLIVSSGYGTWGPPIRIGTSSEIVAIAIHFSPQV